LTSEQLSEWEAYDRLDPIGSWREDYRLAYLSALVTNIAISMNVKKGTTPELKSPIDFMLNFDVTNKEEVKEVTQQSVEEMKNAVLGINKAFTKKERRKKEPPKHLVKKVKK